MLTAPRFSSSLQQQWIFVSAKTRRVVKLRSCIYNCLLQLNQSLEKHGRYADLDFGIPRTLLQPPHCPLWPWFGTSRPLGADQESARVLYRRHIPFDTPGNAEGSRVGESPYSPKDFR
ncbi:uncharacterized protein LOC124282485 [Haliotis rubra]|uniref:uncharacterized protein LOC124282485 n=1 Tax=Haliotis rubra TaxID=36100 RepID=UPI001EE4F8E4|nr:uncharacterized protein LOC124282485 [Haliotis rubra]